MRILIFSELFYPQGGGAELATWLYSKLLAEKGFEITIVTKKFPNEPAAELLNDRIAIFRIPMKMMLRSRYDTLANTGTMFCNFINKLIAKSDIIYIPCGWYSMIPIAKIHKKPVIVHLHNYFIACPTSLMYDFVRHEVGPSSLKSFVLHEIIERRRKIASVVASSLMNEFLGNFYNRMGMLADALIFVSNAQMNLVLSKFPHIKEKSCVIYNPIPDDPLVLAKRKGVGYFGGRSFVKGYYVLLRALKSLGCLNGAEAYLMMTAEEQRTVRMGNGVRVNFLPKLDPDSFFGMMRELSVVVVPSLSPEPQPYALLESMLYGKLVVASSIGGIPEIVDGLSSGVKLTKPGDYDEISDGLTSFLTLELEEANEIGIKNREYILQKFDNEKTIKSFTCILDKVLTR
jgi:glycosyltransferase involved in cell wall biosynthesis